jgi:hypothetical protein
LAHQNLSVSFAYSLRPEKLFARVILRKRPRSFSPEEISSSTLNPVRLPLPISPAAGTRPSPVDSAHHRILPCRSNGLRSPSTNPRRGSLCFSIQFRFFWTAATEILVSLEGRVFAGPEVVRLALPLYPRRDPARDGGEGEGYAQHQGSRLLASRQLPILYLVCLTRTAEALHTRWSRRWERDSRGDRRGLELVRGGTVAPPRLGAAATRTAEALRFSGGSCLLRSGSLHRRGLSPPLRYPPCSSHRSASWTRSPTRPAWAREGERPAGGSPPWERAEQRTAAARTPSLR